jgi:hypothetical protein
MTIVQSLKEKSDIDQYRASCSHMRGVLSQVCKQKNKQMHRSISKKAPSLMAMTLAMVSMIPPADAQTSSTICTSTSPGCCWVKRSWELMGKNTSVSSTSATACCYSLGSTTGKTITQTSGIPGVNCTSTGIVTQITWKVQSLRYSIPTELSNLVNLTTL